LLKAIFVKLYITWMYHHAKVLNSLMGEEGAQSCRKDGFAICLWQSAVLVGQAIARTMPASGGNNQRGGG
jgi:hypothetical protein